MDERAFRRFRRGFALRVCAGALATGCILGLACTGPEPMTHKPKDVCYEDEPCWNCETMGNHICGPGARP
jgi:hypothetical protein